MKRLLLWLTCFICLAACSKKTDKENSPQTVLPPPTNSNAWTLDQQKNPAGNVIITTKTLKPEYETWSRALTQATELQALPLSSQWNTRVYRLQSRSATDSTMARVAYIAPKIYAYNPTQSSDVTVIDNKDGTLTIPFQIVMIDGLSKNIPSPDGVTTVQLPNVELINQDALSKKIHEFGLQQLAPLDGCPKQFIISVGDQNFDATPFGFKSADQCELNKPFVVSLRVKKKFADEILNKALFDSIVDIRALYEVKVSYVTSETTISFDREKILTELKTSLQASKSPYVQATVESTLKSILQKQLMTMVIQGDPDRFLEKLISKAINQFFTPFFPTSQTPSPEICKSTVCLNWNESSSNEEDSLTVQFLGTSSTLTGQSILTMGKLQPLYEPQVLLEPGNSPLSTKEIAGRELGMTVREGDVLEFIPDSVSIEHRDLTHPNITLLNSEVECVNRKSWPGGNICLKTARFDRQKFAYDLTSFETIFNPLSKINGFYDGVLLKFVSQKKETLCSFSDLAAQGDGRKFIVSLKNSDHCSIFDPQKTVGNEMRMLWLVNRLQIHDQYRAGEIIKDFHEAPPAIERFPLTDYLAEARLALQLKLRTYPVH